jgi:DNA-binding GntR family transcriptional regulator
MTVPSASGPAAERDRAGLTLEHLITAAADMFRTAEERATATIRNAILAGVFPPGRRLPQDELAGMLHVSRMPIRSALRQLESEGLVEFHAHRGATVRVLSPEEVMDLYELRILVETFALRKTVRAIDDEALAELHRMAKELEGAADHESWIVARHTFYQFLYSIGNTPRVVSTIMQFRAEVSRYTVALGDPRSQTHLELLDRIGLRDADLAAAWLEAHLRHVARERRRQVAEIGHESADVAEGGIEK